MSNGRICEDTDCEACGATAEERTCSRCGKSGAVTDCGHRAQPRPISSGWGDGYDPHLVFCAACSDALADDFALATRLCALADEGGTIQAVDMVPMSSDPTHHTTTSLRSAIAALRLDARAVSRAMPWFGE